MNKKEQKLKEFEKDIVILEAMAEKYSNLDIEKAAFFYKVNLDDGLSKTIKALKILFNIVMDE